MNPYNKNKIPIILVINTYGQNSFAILGFINVGNNSFLNFRAESGDGWGYCVFAEVSEGMDVVNKIKDVKTGNAGHHQDVPAEDVVIQKVELAEQQLRLMLVIKQKSWLNVVFI